VPSEVRLREAAIFVPGAAECPVARLDWEEKKASVRPVDVDYSTGALMGVSVNVLDTFEHEPAPDLDRNHGEVKLTSLATMFKKIRFHTHENIGAGPIRLP